MKQLELKAFAETSIAVRNYMETKGFSLSLKEAEEYWFILCDEILNLPPQAATDEEVLHSIIDQDLVYEQYFKMLMPEEDKTTWHDDFRQLYLRQRSKRDEKS